MATVNDFLAGLLKVNAMGDDEIIVTEANSVIGNRTTKPKMKRVGGAIHVVMPELRERKDNS